MRVGPPAGRAPSGLVAVLAQACVLCTALATVLVLTLHGLRPDLRRQLLSTFAVGPYGRVMTLAFFLVAAAVLALAGALRGTLRFRGRTALAPRLLTLSALAMVLAGLFPVATDAADPVRWAVIHGPASQVSFGALTVSMVLMAAACGGDPRWRGFHRTAWALSLVWVVTVAFSVLAFRSPLEGIAQRLMTTVLVVWLTLTATTVAALLREPAATAVESD